jgi:hypothetical protein
MIVYKVAVVPKEAILGQSILAKLECANDKQPASDVTTFEHASLTLALHVEGVREPVRLFPNRRVIHSGSRLVREAAAGGIENLEPEEVRDRDFTLTNLFPNRLFDVGQFKFSYTLYDGKREQGPAPFAFRVAFDQLSGQHLLERLEDADAQVRRCAANLLQRLSGLEMKYDPAAPQPARQAAVAQWAETWRRRGSPLKWQGAKR